jgi:protein tyrosine phosphatase (PTP) superfamily phosphohydrolase (DUF442 family)
MVFGFRKTATAVVGPEIEEEEKESTERISNFATHHGINIHFIPPGSSHMGVIWEAEVKSMKFHLRRVAGNAKLTFEEFYT